LRGLRLGGLRLDQLRAHDLELGIALADAKIGELRLGRLQLLVGVQLRRRFSSASSLNKAALASIDWPRCTNSRSSLPPTAERRGRIHLRPSPGSPTACRASTRRRRALRSARRVRHAA
jgi:hypothetical protein